MEKITVIPENVRGLGDIVSPKNTYDFSGYGVKVSAGTDTNYGKVFNVTYNTRAFLTLDMPSGIEADDTSFTVTATVKNSSNNGISGVPVHVFVNDVDYFGTSGNNGSVSFTVATDGSGEYVVQGWSVVNSSYASASAYGVVYVLDGVESVEFFAEKPILQSGQTSVFASRVLDENGEPVKGVEVCFYKE